MTKLLEGKTAVIYGASGSLGSATAKAFAREGATVHLAGRTRATLQAVADEIAAAGGQAEVAVLDATDEAAVEAHADQVGRIDVSFNLILRGDDQGTPLVDMSVERVLGAIVTGVTTSFVTARAAARHGAGVILHLTSGSSRGTQPGMGNTGPTDAAVEAMHRYLAAELGPNGVRVVGIHTAGVHGTLSAEKIAKVAGVDPSLIDVDAINAGLAQGTMLKRQPEIQQIAETATFLASDRAGAITSGIVNATCGLVAG
jgi:NAD(P)-dependent dehydrogenase (short-subunit alcohol dehydrogenase family)